MKYIASAIQHALWRALANCCQPAQSNHGCCEVGSNPQYSSRRWSSWSCCVRNSFSVLDADINGIGRGFDWWWVRLDHLSSNCLKNRISGPVDGAPSGPVDGALHRVCRMVKKIYSMKMELLYDGNESVIQLTAEKPQGIQQLFNRFVINIYTFNPGSLVVMPLMHP